MDYSVLVPMIFADWLSAGTFGDELLKGAATCNMCQKGQWLLHFCPGASGLVVWFSNVVCVDCIV